MQEPTRLNRWKELVLEPLEGSCGFDPDTSHFRHAQTPVRSHWSETFEFLCLFVYSCIHHIHNVCLELSALAT